MKDELGERIKHQYEDRTRFFLPRRTYAIIRLDGKAFHTYTRGLEKPFDQRLFDDIDNAIIALCEEVQGVQFAYTQSDEISLLLTDFETPQTCAWFDGNIQKMVSVSSSILTAEFNSERIIRLTEEMEKCENDFPGALSRLAYFDSRVFTIPDPTEVYNYFVWRQQDCIRNSVSMVAQSLFSHNELNGKNQSQMHEMIHSKGKNWSTDYPQGFKNGRLIVKENYESTIGGDRWHNEDGSPNTPIKRTRWVSTGAWKFTEDPQKLQSMIPKYE